MGDMSMWETVKEWCNRQERPAIVQWIDPSNVRPPKDLTAATADQVYFRIKLVQMVLGQSRAWFRDYAPSVHALVQLDYGDSRIQIPGVLAADPSMYAPSAVFQNGSILPLVPFRGGEVSLEVALVALPGDDHLGNALEALANVATLISAPISGALAIAGKVKESAEIVLRKGAQVQLAYRNTFSSDQGASQLRDGYFVIANMSPAELEGRAFVVEGDQLRVWDGRSPAEPLRNVDYMLLRIQVLTTRDDKAWLKDVEAARAAALDAFTVADNAEAERTYRAAIATILKHRELVDADRRALAQKLQTELAPLRSSDRPAGLTRGRTQSWEEFVADLPEVTDRSPPTEAEFLAITSP